MKNLLPTINVLNAAIVAVILIVLTVPIWFSYSTKEDVTITVTDKELVCESSYNGSSDCRYLIFTDKETFENTDSMIHFKFNSSDVYGQLEEDETYEVTVNWFRLSFLSIYRNILNVKEV